MYHVIIISVLIGVTCAQFKIPHVTSYSILKPEPAQKEAQHNQQAVVNNSAYLSQLPKQTDNALYQQRNVNNEQYTTQSEHLAQTTDVSTKTSLQQFFENIVTNLISFVNSLTIHYSRIAITLLVYVLYPIFPSLSTFLADKVRRHKFVLFSLNLNNVYGRNKIVINILLI